MVSGRGHLRLFFTRAAVCIFFISAYHYSISAESLWLQQTTPVRQDTIPADTLEKKYVPSFRPTFNYQDRFGDPFFHRQSSSPLYIEPSNVEMGYELDTSGNYTVYEKIGDVDYKPPAEVTFEEYKRYHADKIRKDYFKSRSQGLDGESAVSGRRLIPKIYISPVFDRIFGGSFVEINPRGRVLLDFGARWQRIQNPSIPIRQQRNGGFEFDQQISMNVVGKIGEKLQITANFDNNNSFDFENNLKVEYTGYEEDIIKKLEVGNVSLPINNSLITGAQNLFGVKAQLQFGKLYVTGVASSQRGKTDVVEVESGGVQARKFEIRSSEYDENRHFFLGHFFRDNYEAWLQGIPNVISGVNITRLEVYVINRNNDTETLRNIAAFMDLAEGSRIYQDVGGLIGPGNGGPASNDANGLFFELTSNPDIRNVDNLSDILDDPNSFDMEASLHYEKMNQSRKLKDSEYRFNPQLGYLTLFRKLQNDESLAVAYEYNYNGRIYKVGELTEDYSNRPENEVIFLKMLRPRKINIRDQNEELIPSWDLMMKNIYNLNASQVNKDGFQFRIVYRDDRTGVDNPSLHEGTNTRDVPLIELLGLDRLGPANDPPKDGNFDYVEDVTINVDNGQIIFPVLEPFGSHLESLFLPSEQDLVQRYVYDTLYRTTRADAQLVGDKNKFFLTGELQAGSTSEIILPGINIAEGSVRVLAGGSPLEEGRDYTVDYNFGKVTIINEGVLNSGKRIKITYEKADLFNFQTRTLVGTRLDYRFSEDINFGATLLHLNERPLITRVNIGDEPTRNTKYGFDMNVRKESRFLTRMVDALPFISTKETSLINFNGEFAQLLPGTSNIVDGEGTSYIDDFEAAVTPYTLGTNNPSAWKLAATPRTDDNRFSETLPGDTSKLGSGYKRGKLAWYIVDNVFYRSGGSDKPDNINEEDLENHYVRPVIPQEIFPNQSRQVVNTNEPIFDVAYFPTERGQYNYNPDLQSNGYFSPTDARENWAGITRAITNEVDFDKTNVEFIEFWLMDPFINSENGRVLDGVVNAINRTGGDLVFNLGSISEDLMVDGRHAFENGLPRDGTDDPSLVDFNEWGRVTKQQYLNNAFDNADNSRPNQDVGLDGLPSEREVDQFEDYLNNVLPSLDPEAQERIQADPSADNFQYYLGSELDQADQKILERYKNFNGMEGNSPNLVNSTLSFTPSGSPIPDNEDLNNDNSLSELEEYYEYRIKLEPNNLRVGENYIVQTVTNNINGDDVNWYLFRIPIRNPDKVVGNINGFKSIRYLRMYMTNWEQPVVMRMANFRLMGSQWRRYNSSLQQKRFDEPPENNDTKFQISVVNIEENSQGEYPYVLPPGFSRDRDNTSVIDRQLNEQSLQLCVENLQDKDARGVFKDVKINLINYGRIKMFLHAQDNGTPGGIDDGELRGFIRLNTDLTENYYEIEVPLQITNAGSSDPNEIWPAENEIDIAIEDLYQLKARRNQIFDETQYQLPYSEQIGRYRVTVVGRPAISKIDFLFIGVRNPDDANENPLSACIWANELRVTDFDQTAGWAANATFNAKLADFANVVASTRYTTFGFGSLQSKIQQREQKETLNYDVAANIYLDKLLPEKIGLKIPMYMSYEKTTITPQFDPLDPDIPLESTLESFQTAEEANAYKDKVIDESTRRSLNFTNVRKVKTNPEAKNHFWDVENLSLTYAYSDVNSKNYNTEKYQLKSYKGALAYNYTTNDISIEPFKNSKGLKSKWLKLIKEFNFSPLPSSFTFRADLDRRFIQTQYRNQNLTTEGVDPNFEKYFTFNRIYNMRWNFSRGLSLDYNARANTIIDEPEGEINSQEKKDVIWQNLRDGGRMKNFDQDWSLNYRLPLDKIPLTDWINTDLRYKVGYTWTAGALNQQETYGNLIQNTRDRGVTGKLDFVKLYNKSEALKKVNTPPRRTSASSSRTRTSTRTRPQAADTVKSPGAFGNGFLRFIMMIRSVNMTYDVREGTLLPGFKNTPRLFGMDQNWASPGWPFILGDQDPNIRFKAAENGWLVSDRESANLTTNFSQSRIEDLAFKGTLEPFREFKVQLDMRKNKTAQYKEIFRFDTTKFDMGDPLPYSSLTPNRFGTYSISFLAIGTSFVRDRDDNSSEVFDTFLTNLDVIRQRLNQVNPVAEYNNESQDVMIPAFLAAYAKRDVNTIALSPFPGTPIPNWRVDYSGLGKMEGLREVFSNVTVSHAYSSNYTVQKYTSSQQYSETSLRNRVEDYPLATEVNENGDLIPVYVINQVVMSERFSPLIGISVRTQTRMNITMEYKRERNLALNLSNTQITELNSKDVSLTFGYTKPSFKLPFRVQGRQVVLDNDLTFRLNFTIRDTKTTQRKLTNIHTVTNGNINFQFNPQVQYVLNQRLDVTLYFERNINTPRISNSFPRSTTAFGIRVNFSLAQ